MRAWALGISAGIQAAAVLYRYAKAKYGVEEKEYAPLAFTDAESIEPYAVLPVQWLAESGFIREGTAAFRPGDAATRAEIALLLAKAMDFFAD